MNPNDDNVRLTLTDSEGVLLGVVTVSRKDLSDASRSALAALALVGDVAAEAGVR